MTNDMIKLYNRKLFAKLNDVCSEDGQWHRSGNKLRLFDNQRVYYHAKRFVGRQRGKIDDGVERRAGEREERERGGPERLKKGQRRVGADRAENGRVVGGQSQNCCNCGEQR
ncbi:hypothetical protein BpHYR1_038999 [Brachionus plicatilis]|uniref:Uncharacterized protein n=1 Tax=Brachionus plicatilis TaxID=10195 RepID=A0A3M7QJF8_BRAPC|nr:hypothetical protein BpHYR1_038999 [Brachionus plicatilis]